VKKELGKWILDVAKYITTAGIIAPFVADVHSIWWYIVVAVIVILVLYCGLVLVGDDKKIKKSKK